MQTYKTQTLTVRLTPETKAALREVASEEQRSLANMLEVMIRWYVAGRPADGGRVPPLANSRTRE
ncbi:MAG: hypothetical protein V2I82_11625 [Halieaceae bacterium]|jgi:hypothetical protein|nr:hypothetical protein [Halieaceae bacterium]